MDSSPCNSRISLLVTALLILISLCLISEGRPLLRNGTYQVIEGSLVSQQWKIATLEFDVGEELYFPVVLPCVHCTSREYERNDDKELCVCDFSTKERCGKAPAGCPKETCKEEDVRKFCKSDRLSNWQTLRYTTKSNKEIEDGDDEFFTLSDQTLIEDETKYYRLQALDPCTAYFVKANFHFGMADIFMSQVVPEPSQLDLQRYTDFARYPDRIEILLCPDSAAFQLGTYYFAFIGRSPNVSFDIDVYSTKTVNSDARPIQTNTSSNPICSDDNRFVCLQDGVVSQIPTTGWTPYRFDVITTKPNECATVTLFVQVETGDGDLFGAWDVPVLLDDTYNPVYRSSVQGSDVIYTEKCFSTPGTYHFYAIVNPFDTGLYYMSASTKPRGYLRRGLDYGSYQYSYIATRFLFGRCPGFNPNTTTSLVCADWGFSCRTTWTVFPSSEPDPFWPIPSIWNVRTSPFSASLFATLREHQTPLLDPLKNKIIIAVLLENTIFGKNTVYLREDQLASCSFSSMGFAFSRDRKSLVGTAGVEKKRNVEERCEPERLDRVLAVGRQFKDELEKGSSDFDKTLQFTYQVNTLMFSNTWSSCSAFANSFLNSTTRLRPTPSTACLITNTTAPEYLSDPCCNNKLLPFQCCNPRNLLKDRTLFEDTLPSRVEERCMKGSEECVESYLGDYLVVNQRSLQCSSFSSDEYPNIVINGIDFYRKCKAKVNLDALVLGEVSCRFDDECEFGGMRHKCNLVTNRCVANSDVEKETLKCVRDGMNEYQEFFLKEALRLPGRKEDDEFFEAFQKALSTGQCQNFNGHHQNQRESYIYTTKAPFCGRTLNCLTRNCLDTSCELQPTSCVAICGMSWVQTIQDVLNNRDHCEGTKKCNWKGDNCRGGNADCESDCEEKEGFCGYCTDPAHCIAIPGVDSEQECENTDACYLPDGTVELLSKKECEKRQMCSKPCHDQLGCESRSGVNLCVSPEPQNKCAGVWDNKLNLCTYPRFSQSICGRAGFTFHTCSQLSLAECETCYLGGSCSVNQTVLQCHVVPRVQCDTKEECESTGGYCDDAYWYDTFGTTIDDYGACLIPPNYNLYQVQATCSGGRILTPEGCYTRTYTSEATCLTTAGAWYRRLATDEESCTSKKGCANYDQVNSLAPMNRSSCEECGYEMKPYYKWTPGKWNKGKPISLEWKRPSLENLYRWSSGIDWNALYKLFTRAASSSVLADMRSQVLCDFNARSVPIEVLGCACNERDGESASSCFSNSRKPLESGAGRPCVGLGADVQTLESSLKISRSAVSSSSPSRCVDVSLSTISVYSYQQAKRVAFSPLTKVRDYDTFNIVKNSDDAIVGRVMSDGLLIEMNGDLESYTVCLTSKEAEVGSPPSRFDTWDIAVPRNGDKEFLRSLMVESRRQSSSENGEVYCFKIDNPSREERYFLISRLSRPEAADGSLYGSQSIAWWIFAVLYTLFAIWCLFTLTAHFFGYSLHYYFLGLFGFLSIMCVVRAVYFYLLATRVFDSSTILAVAYFLIEFPTLLYFTAFSCLAAFWIFLLPSSHQKHSSHQRMVLVGFLLFNLFLYILFVVLIVLFQTLPSTSDSVCEGRVASEEDSTNQQIVSLFYQSFMAGVSLLIAIVVTLSGGKLLFSLGLKKRSFERKVAVVTVICALGLLLHCAFILYLTATLEYDFVITVCMIVLSELLPIFCIAFQFSLVRGMCFAKAVKLPSYNKRGHFHKALTTILGSKSTVSSKSDISSTHSPWADTSDE